MNIDIYGQIHLAISSKARIASKIDLEYRDLTSLPAAVSAQQGGAGPARPNAAAGPSAPTPAGNKRKLIEGMSSFIVASHMTKAGIACVIATFLLTRSEFLPSFPLP